MLKASSSGIVLTLVVHTKGQGVAHCVGVHRLCIRHLQSHFSSFSTSRPTVQLASAASLALAPRPDGQNHAGPRSASSHAAHSFSGTGTVQDPKGGGVEERANEGPDHYNQIKEYHIQQSLPVPRAHQLQREKRPAFRKKAHSSKVKAEARARSLANERTDMPSPEPVHVEIDRNERQRKMLGSSLQPNLSPVADLLDKMAIDHLSAHDLKQICMKRSNTLEEAWNAYQRLVALSTGAGENLNNVDYTPGHKPFINEYILHNVSTRLVRSRPRSRENFLRLLSVYARLRRERERQGRYPLLLTYQWNALIHFAGIGLRKTTLEAYNAALDVFGDMMAEADWKSGKQVEFKELGGNCKKGARPDIYTFTTLLNIAVKTGHPPAIEHATKLLRESSLGRTRVTHLCTARFRLQTEGLRGVRNVLSVLAREGHAVGIDGVNAFLHSAGLDGRTDIVQGVYAALRQNLHVSGGQIGSSDDHAAKDGEESVTVEGITFAKSVIPDEATYVFVIQTLAYHGYIVEALQAFTDMLSTKRDPPEDGFFQPSYAVFRSLFCSFARHGQKLDEMPPFARSLYARQTDWNWERLQVLLDAFFELKDCNTTERMIYWVMLAVQKTTGSGEVLREVWAKLNARFRIRKGGRLLELDKMYGEKEPARRPKKLQQRNTQLWWEGQRKREARARGSGYL